ncbi:hypothetical protein NJH83_09400, partial [Pseudomonas chlororaphis]|uniref:hypothetical protein n=1 Tax=Pseudomonas chlororaphis TaxID=587753 RepID=UPI00209B9266
MLQKGHPNAHRRSWLASENTRKTCAHLATHSPASRLLQQPAGDRHNDRYHRLHRRSWLASENTRKTCAHLATHSPASRLL